MIIGIGTDIVKVARMQENLQQFGKHFTERILFPSERHDFATHKHPAHFLAKRFAAKEALFKALGGGFRSGIALKDCGVAHDEKGKPFLVFNDKAQAILQEQGVQQTHLSLADETDYAIAMVVLEG